MPKAKKIVLPILALILGFSISFTPNALASELPNSELPEPDLIITESVDGSTESVVPNLIPRQSISVDQLTPKQNSGYTTNAIQVIELGKPIAYKRYISNYELDRMAKLYDKKVTILNIINTILIPSGAGIATSLATAIGYNPHLLRSAADKGQHAYVVSVYANGVAPSLSKISYVYYTKNTLRFEYRK